MEQTDMIYGHHAVVEALEMGTGNKLYVQDDLRGKKVEQIKKLARDHKVSISWTAKKKLDEMTDKGVHQGLVLRVSAYAYHDLKDLILKADQVENPLILVLDSLTDPHNLGSILRTADAMGVTGVVIPKHRSVGITPIVAKIATGALEHVPVARVTNLNQALQVLKQEGFWTFATDMEGTPLHKWNTQGKLAVIIGNEGKGVSQKLKADADELITIPMEGHVQSLNASVATGMVLYEVLRNRQL